MRLSVEELQGEEEGIRSRPKRALETANSEGHSSNGGGGELGASFFFRQCQSRRRERGGEGKNGHMHTHVGTDRRIGVLDLPFDDSSRVERFSGIQKTY